MVILVTCNVEIPNRKVDNVVPTSIIATAEVWRVLSMVRATRWVQEYDE